VYCLCFGNFFSCVDCGVIHCVVESMVYCALVQCKNVISHCGMMSSLLFRQELNQNMIDSLLTKNQWTYFIMKMLYARKIFTLCIGWDKVVVLQISLQFMLYFYFEIGTCIQYGTMVTSVMCSRSCIKLQEFVNGNAGLWWKWCFAFIHTIICLFSFCLRTCVFFLSLSLYHVPWVCYS